MLKKFFIAAALLLQFSAMAQNPTEEAIKKVYINETAAYIKRDMATLASYHVQSKNDILIVNTSDGNYSLKTGWKDISDDLLNYFAAAPKDSSTIERTNFIIKVSGQMAFVSFDSQWKAPDGNTTSIHEFRTLLQVNKVWKILAVQAYINYKPS